MFRFVTIIPLSFWAIILLMLFMWVAMGLWWMVGTAVVLAMLGSGRTSFHRLVNEPEAGTVAIGALADHSDETAAYFAVMHNNVLAPRCARMSS